MSPLGPKPSFQATVGEITWRIEPRMGIGGDEINLESNIFSEIPRLNFLK